MLLKFGKSGAPLCCFWNLKDETPYYLFYKYFWYHYYKELLKPPEKFM